MTSIASVIGDKSSVFLSWTQAVELTVYQMAGHPGGMQGNPHLFVFPFSISLWRKVMSVLQRTVEIFALYTGVLPLQDCPDDVSEKGLWF